MIKKLSFFLQGGRFYYIPFCVVDKRTQWSSFMYLFSCSSFYFHWRHLQTLWFICLFLQHCQPSFLLEKFQSPTKASLAWQVWERLWKFLRNSCFLVASVLLYCSYTEVEDVTSLSTIIIITWVRRYSITTTFLVLSLDSFEVIVISILQLRKLRLRVVNQLAEFTLLVKVRVRIWMQVCLQRVVRLWSASVTCYVL